MNLFQKYTSGCGYEILIQTERDAVWSTGLLAYASMLLACICTYRLLTGCCVNA